MAEQIQDIPLDQIDAPKIAMRSDVHDDGIEELASSIREIGLQEPVILRSVHQSFCDDIFKEESVRAPQCSVGCNRYEIIIGHRRVTAARLANLVVIDGIVRNRSDSEVTVMKLHENLLRRDVNPIDEAIFLSRVMLEQTLDIKKIAKLTQRSTEYIASRLEILNYPDYLIEAIGEKQISLGAAEYLAKITDERVRKNYVSYAISGGISVKRAIAWHDSWKRGAGYSNPTLISEPDLESGVAREVHKELCVICQNHDVPDEMMLHYAHRKCVETIQT